MWLSLESQNLSFKICLPLVSTNRNTQYSQILLDFMKVWQNILHFKSNAVYNSSTKSYINIVKCLITIPIFRSIIFFIFFKRVLFSILDYFYCCTPWKCKIRYSRDNSIICFLMKTVCIWDLEVSWIYSSGSVQVLIKKPRIVCAHYRILQRKLPKFLARVLIFSTLIFYEVSNFTHLRAPCNFVNQHSFNNLPTSFH